MTILLSTITKGKMTTYIFLLISAVFSAPANDYTGAWEIQKDDGTTGVWIVTDQHFSICYYKTDPPEFLYTEGGKWSAKDGQIEFQWEFHTDKPELVGEVRQHDAEIMGDNLSIAGSKWKRLDDGTPGSLAGAWLITGRQRDGEISERTPGARKTMKILSGTRFQWIAYNSETGDFFGTGGGTYTTEGGKYTENIKVFSRDNTRVGASLEFDYDLKEGKWHHSGFSSRGDPMYEVWSRRSQLGI
jgi:hypothetical protein